MTYDEYDRAIDALIGKLRMDAHKFDSVMPVPMDGYYPAIKVSQALDKRIVSKPGERTLVIDSLCDSCTDAGRYEHKAVAVVYMSGKAQFQPAYYGEMMPEGPVSLPDEEECGIEGHIRKILEHIGEDPAREGLVGTPDRISRMWKEIFRGYDNSQKPKITTFPNGKDGIVYDSMIVDEGTYYSMCEHHMMPFFGRYWFAYIPNPKGRILGLSKVGRVIDYCAARLQIQERLTREVVEMLSAALGTEYPPLGIALVMRGTHLCKTMRGVRKDGTMTSCCLAGSFRTDRSLRDELMAFVNGMSGQVQK